MEWIIAVLSTLAGFFIAHIYHNHEKNRNKHEKAIEVAKEFETILNSDHFIIQSVFSEILKHLDLENKFKFLEEDVDNLKFTKQELSANFKEEAIKGYKEFKDINNVCFIKILSECYTEIDSEERYFASVISKFDIEKSLEDNIEDFRIKFNENRNLEKVSSDEINVIFRRMHSDLRIYIINLVTKFNVSYNHVFNRLEWMSMYFVTGVADSDAVYKSLHQVYFVLMKCFYIEIALKNDKEVYNRYYTNITSLYKTWQSKYIMEKLAFDQASNNAEKAHSRIKKRV